MQRTLTLLLTLITTISLCGEPAAKPVMKQESESGITHSFAVFGGETYIVMKDGTIPWTYPGVTRDGFVAPDGVLLAVSKCKEYPGGAVVFV
jgi:hypothetical protein